MNIDEFEEEVERERLIELLELATLGSENLNLKKLEKQLKRIDSYLQQMEDEGEDSEFYVDIAFDISPILNGVEFRTDEVSEDAIKSPEILSMVEKYVASRDENVEVVLATNPHLSEELKWSLAASEYEWEEDGTREALARNQDDPKLLEYLAEVGNVNVKHQVALNTLTPASVLDRLAEETEQCNFQMEECLFGELSTFRGYARWCVAQNPNTDTATLQRIIGNQLVSLGAEADGVIAQVAKTRLGLI
jgi:Asp-tRNA(Asn)/Glu-tRNA(Gln) amidotransferase C subunit